MRISEYINLNGNLMKSDAPSLLHSNRAFKYGDGIFETMRAINGKVNFFDEHFTRLICSAEKLKLEIPTSFNIKSIALQINELLQKNKLFKASRIRLSIFRNGEGFYTPVTNTFSFLIESSELESIEYQINKKGLMVDIYPDLKKNKSFLSGIKSCNSLLYIMAGLYKNENKLDDCLLLNDDNIIIEAISSNLFIVKDKYIYTSSVKEGCIPGIMREIIIELAIKLNYTVYDDCYLKETDLLNADEIFLTNAIQGIQWVVAFKDRRYYNKIATKLISELNKVVII